MEDKLTILLRLFKEDKITQEEFKILSKERPEYVFEPKLSDWSSPLKWIDPLKTYVNT